MISDCRLKNMFLSILRPIAWRSTRLLHGNQRCQGSITKCETVLNIPISARICNQKFRLPGHPPQHLVERQFGDVIGGLSNSAAEDSHSSDEVDSVEMIVGTIRGQKRRGSFEDRA